MDHAIVAMLLLARDWADWVLWAANTLLAVAAVIGIAVAYKTLTATKAAAEAAKASADVATATLAEMKDTTERQLRAYVCVNSAMMKFRAPNVPEAQVHFKNCGQTPAHNVRGWIHTWYGPYPLGEPLPTAPDDLRKGNETLAPGRTSVFVTGEKPPLQPQWLSILGTQRFTLFVYWEIRYQDIFGKERATKYRLIHGGNEPTHPVEGKDGVIKGWLLKPDAEGNEAS